MSADTLPGFHRKVRALGTAITPDLEIIFVNDDSPDGSLESACEMANQDGGVRVIDLSRTFGRDKALLTGLAHASGDLILTADCNQPESAELLPHFIVAREASQADSVRGLASGEIWRLMSREFVDAVLLHRDREPRLAELFDAAGFKQITVAAPVRLRDEERARERRIFGAAPAYGSLLSGAAIFAISAAAAAGGVVARLFFGAPLPPWFWLTVSIWLIAGAVLSCLGILAIYADKMVTEARDRPDTIVRAVLRPGSGDGAAHV